MNLPFFEDSNRTKAAEVLRTSGTFSVYFLTSRKCVIPIVCVKLGKWYVVRHNCVILGVFNDYIMNNYMFRPVLAIFRLS